MRRRPSLVVVGDVVLDRDIDGTASRLSPDAPVPVVDVEHDGTGPGAAGLTALLCAADGVEVTLVAPWTDDEAGRRWRSDLAAAGITLEPLGAQGATRVKTRVRAGNQVVVRYDSGGPAHPQGPLPARAAAAIADADVVLVSCYGRGTSGHGPVRGLLAERARRRPVVWDPHPAGAHPVPGTTLVTPNLAEARNLLGDNSFPGDQLAMQLVLQWQVGGVAVTCGGDGAWLATPNGEPLRVPTRVVTGDPCGAGDRLASAAAVALAHGRTVSEAVTEAVESASRFVADGGASGYRGTGGDTGRLGAPASHEPPGEPHRATARDVVRRVRDTGGTLVATGGCFDGLHAGHVRCLQAARGLGDALVVLLNSDASVRRRKGAGRPVHEQGDRVAVLESLACVDAVVVFEDDDPSGLLTQLRPDVWAKGGDYEGADLAEAPLVRGWGGRVVLLPYLSGRSTTAILDRST